MIRLFFERNAEIRSCWLYTLKSRFSGAWTDGCGTTSRETAEVRKTQNLKQVDDGLFAMVSMMGGELGPEFTKLAT